MELKPWEVPTEQLRPLWDAEQFAFETTEELPPLERPVGQQRALAAMELGLGTHGDGFHLFVSGPPGTGRTFAVRKSLEVLTPQQPTPGDWCYLHNFEDQDGMIPTVTLKPEPIPLSLKVELIDEPLLYQLLFNKEFGAAVRAKAASDGSKPAAALRRRAASFRPHRPGEVQRAR